MPLSRSNGLGLFQLDATAAAAAICDGRISATEYVQSCLERINALEEAVQAWTYLDPDWALEQAAAVDLAHKQGKPLVLPKTHSRNRLTPVILNSPYW